MGGYGHSQDIFPIAVQTVGAEVAECHYQRTGHAPAEDAEQRSKSAGHVATGLFCDRGRSDPVRESVTQIGLCDATSNNGTYRPDWSRTFVPLVSR